MPFFDAFKKKSKNQQKIREHFKNLISKYNEFIESSHKADSDLEKIFQNIPNNKSFLCHLATGYENTYLLFMNYILLKREIDTQIMPESIWKEKTKQANGISLEFKHDFEKLLLKITHGSEEFEGICEECSNWYDKDDPSSKELISKLKVFKMPF